MLSLRSTLVASACAAVLAACGNSMMPADGGDVVVVMDTPTMTDVHDVVRRDTRGGCAAATTCDACAQMHMNGGLSCGWSISGMHCIDANPMDVTMSADGSSSGRDWAPLPGMCPGSHACQANTDCVGCALSDNGTVLNGCGWCKTTNTCIPGIGASSQDGTCTGMGTWFPNGAEAYCDNAPQWCAMHSTSCMDCTATPFCGVCEGTGVCMPGTAMGPLVSGAQQHCTGRWAWLTSDCAGFNFGSPDGGTDAAPPTDAPADAPADAPPADVVHTDAGSDGPG